MPRFAVLALLVLTLGPRPARAQEGAPTAEVVETPATPAAPRALEHEDYERWRRIRSESVSADGRWVLFTLTSGDPKADATLVIRETQGERRWEVQRGTQARFTRDSRFVVYRVSPERESVEKAKKEKKKPEDQPKSKLEILDLRDGSTHTVPRVRSFQLAEESGRHLAYLLEKPRTEEDDDSAAEEVTPAGGESEGKAGGSSTETSSEEPAKPEAGTEQPVAAEAKAGEEKKPEAQGAKTEKPEAKGTETKQEEGAKKGLEKNEKKNQKKGEAEEGDEKDDSRRDAPGTTLVVRDLQTGSERRYEQVASYLFDEAGRTLVYHHTPEAKDDDALVAVDLASGKSSALVSGRGQYRGLRFDEAGERLVFLSDRDHQEQDPAPFSLYLWRVGDPAAQSHVAPGAEGLPEGWGLADDSSPSFSKSGARVLFSTRELPEPKEAEEEGEKEDEDDDEPEVKVDIWHWQDPLLQPMQLLQADRERRRSYSAVLHLDSGKVVQLGTPEVPSPFLSQRGDGDHALANVNLPYRMEISWDSPRYNDVWVIDAHTGERECILRGVQTSAQLSPAGRFAYWFDREAGHWFARSLKSGQVVNLTELMPHPVADIRDDHPYLDGPFGVAGWCADDTTMLVYDEFDVWATNPTGFWPPICVTDGVGREHRLRLRVVRLDREQDFLPADEPLMLSAFDEDTKASGFFTDQIRSNEPPRKLILEDERISTPRRAEDSGHLLFTRQTFRTFPDLWIADGEFQDPRRLSDANPQQSEYTWGDAELFEWTAADGQRLQGLLYKPDGFDATKQYPMMVYFYERNSQNLHRYVTPAPGSSSINWSFYVSRGYLLFIPDIPYREGYPGRSAEIAVLPGVARLIDTGFVDPCRIGVQGHSWGGYQSAHLVTQTDIFACAESGAPVSNMTSAYGGIRWASGMSRMFQYEKTQSRIGGTLWESLPQYMENSPLFHAPKINTPLLILHNDEDGAVPWYQGIELFVAMRRLGKPCWMFNYNGEAHGLRQRHNQKDWTIRLQQFFDHYLMDAPAPRWLQEGVPAVQKGETLGLDLMPDETGDAPRRSR